MPTRDEEVRSCNVQGITLAHQGRLDEAAEWFRYALRLDPGAAPGHNNLGNILALQGRYAEAVPCYRAAINIEPQDSRSWNNLANSLRELGELDEAITCGRRSLALDPNFADAHSNLGIALEAKGQLDEAFTHCRRAVELRPNFPEAHNNLGLVLRGLDRLDEAAASCREALRQRPNYAEAENNLGMILLRQEKWEEAADCFRRALALRPDLPVAHANLATYYWRQDRLDDATRHAREALRLKPTLSMAHNVQGAINLKQARFADAERSFDEAIRLDPNSADAHTNRGLSWLHQGRLKDGFLEYEWRWKIVPNRRSFEGPAWDGSPVTGKTVLLHAEQGLGDTLQFIRYAPMVKERGASVIVVVAKTLVPLLSRCAGIDRLVAAEDSLPPFDTYAGLLSLPTIFGTTIETIPADVPYLFADEKLIEHWRSELSAFPGLKVGIAWKGNSKHAMDRTRSIPLANFAPLALGGVHLLSLQKGEGTEQLAAVAGRFPVSDLGGRLDTGPGAFTDTAAVMKSLDLVITSDTSIAHLAGGLGVPVWVALPFSPDWRWLLDREDTPWYPTMRLFRQRTPGNWDEVFTRMAAELNRMKSGQTATPASAKTSLVTAISIEIAPGELIDKITILEIKRERIKDVAKLANVKTELDLLTAARDQAIKPSAKLFELTADLKKANLALWDIEDQIRICERDQDFGPRFVELARSVYHTNDHRSAVKRRINELLGSKLIEEKSYEDYQKAPKR